MRYVDAESGDERVIRGLTAQAEEGWCILRWLWPRNAEAVYIEKLSNEQRNGAASALLQPTHADDSAGVTPFSGSLPRQDALKLYTREEYKASNGYRERIDHFGKVAYRVHLVVEQNGEMMLVRQHDDSNRIELSAGKARIRYTIRQQAGWFSKRKTVRIEVHAEVPVERDVLCYVKKEGGYPASRDDGIIYPFAEPFQAGRTELPAIEIGKNEYVRLFFTDGRTYGQLYELILE
ncbi:beta-mannanase [Paenibacillus campi]|uniref:beta-mannanase n=1 Tax=Paenibacillus campi TaxID=3106031 RepID=UPI002AFEF0E1|nr:MULTISPECIES: beta-mannanase [unclassified Paenibacillus]